MALILRGKDKGKEVILHQWCNDWFTIEGSNKVYSPSSLRLNADEIDAVLKSETGIMFGLYKLVLPDGVFKKIKRLKNKF